MTKRANNPDSTVKFTLNIKSYASMPVNHLNKFVENLGEVSMRINTNFQLITSNACAETY